MASRGTTIHDESVGYNKLNQLFERTWPSAQQHVSKWCPFTHRYCLAFKTALGEQGAPLRDASAMQPPQTAAACEHHGLIPALAHAKPQTSGRIAHTQQQQSRGAQRLMHAFEQRAMCVSLDIVQHIHGTRKAIKTKGSFPNEDAARKLVYLALQNADPQWTRTRNWTTALLAFKIHFGDRVPDTAN